MLSIVCNSVVLSLIRWGSQRNFEIQWHHPFQPELASIYAEMMEASFSPLLEWFIIIECCRSTGDSVALMHSGSVSEEAALQRLQFRM